MPIRPGSHQSRPEQVAFLKTLSRGPLFLKVPEEPLSPGLYPGFQMLSETGDFQASLLFFLHPKGTLTGECRALTPLFTCLW